MAFRIGMTWDEGLYVLCGGLALKNVMSRNFSEKAWSFEFHPPFIMYFIGLSLGFYSLIRSILRNGYKINLNKISDEAITSFSGTGALAAVRLPNILFGSLTCVLVYYIGYDIFSSRELGILAALILALLPTFISWSSLAMLEGGVSFFFTLTILSFLKAFNQGSPDVSYILISGLTLGMAFASREFGYFIPAVVLPWFTSRFVSSGFLHFKDDISMLIVWLLTGCIVFIILWPFLWKNPVKQFIKTFSNISQMKSSPKWYFFIINFLSTSPNIVLMFAGAGIISILMSKIGSPLYIILAWFLIPVVIMSLPLFPKRGGVYEMTFIMPAFSLLAGFGMLEVYNIINVADLYPHISGMLSSGVLFLPVIWLIISDFNINPYYMNYYNIFGKKILSLKKYGVVPFGWWGEGMDASMEYLDRNAPPNALVWVYGPKSTALYHSKRSNLLKTTGKAVFYEISKMSKTNVEIGEEAYSWRNGDLNIFLPYYHKEFNEITIDKLKKEYNVDFVVIYKAFEEISGTGSGNSHYSLIHELRKDREALFVSKIKNVEVCWVYKI